MASGYPDWTRAIRLLGVDGDGNPVTVFLDATGRLYSLIIGEDAEGDPVAVRVDDDGQMIMVPRGSSGHYMDVDSDGFITAVLKGTYGEALRTIGLDDDGRITAYMVDDESQWGDVVKVGNAELAARLGAPLAYDWRGKVVAMVDFSRGLGGMYTDAEDTGAGVALDPTNFMSGGYSLKMTGGSDGAFDATIFATVNIPPTDRVGLCINWASDSIFDYLEIWLRAYDGTTRHTAKVRFDMDNNRLEYLDDNEAWQTLATHYEYMLAFSWHSFKLVMDISTDKYVRCLAGLTEHDMSTLDLYAAAHANNPRLEAVVKLLSHSGENQYIWLDSMIVTVGEPE